MSEQYKDWHEVTLVPKLKKLAEEAKGVWSFGLGEATRNGKTHAALWFNEPSNAANQTHFIVRCNPETIIEMCDEINALRTQNTELQRKLAERDAMIAKMNRCSLKEEVEGGIIPVSLFETYTQKVKGK